MTDDTKNEVQLWKPDPFSGTDLLPLDYATQKVDLTGREHIDASDLILPRLKLLQATSDECMDEDTPDAKPGKLFHSGAKEVFDPPIRTLFVAHTKSRGMFPKEDNPRFQGLSRCISRDGITGDTYGDCSECAYLKWGDRNEPPLCSDSHNFTALTPFGPAIVRFSRTSYKTARELLTTWHMSPKPLFCHPVQLGVRRDTKEIQGKNVTFFKLEVKWLQRETVPPLVQDAARALQERISTAHEQGKFGGDDEEKSFDDFDL